MIVTRQYAVLRRRSDPTTYLSYFVDEPSLESIFGTTNKIEQAYSMQYHKGETVGLLHVFEELKKANFHYHDWEVVDVTANLTLKAR